MGVATGIVMEFQFGTNWAAYSRFVSLLALATFALHGCVYLCLKTEGDLQQRHHLPGLPRQSKARPLQLLTSYFQA